MGRVTLSEIFDKHFGHVKYDSRLAKAIYRYQVGYLNSGKEYIEFYGSNLLGVHIVRFLDSDVNRLFDEVLDVDYLQLCEDLKSVTDINQEYKISSDVFNLTLFYLLHKFMTSKVIDGSTRRRALYDVALLFFYRTTAALISYNFRYPADPKIAQQAYANLSQKYLIKQLGSWGKVMDYRANELIDDKSIHYKAILNYNNDTSIVYAINDSQGRVRDMIKNYYSEFAKVHSQGDRVGTTASTYLDAEGEESVKEKTKSIENYVEYIRDIVVDEHSFIKDDLLTVVSRTNANVSFKSLKTCLQWISSEYGSQKQHSLIDDFISISVVHSFHLIQYSIAPKSMRDYPAILVGLKNLLASSRSVDPELQKIRELGERIVKASFPYKVSEPLVIATRNSLVLYLILRVLTGVNK